MLNWLIRSLSRKFLFVITIGFLGTSVLFLTVFTKQYVAQFERERAIASTKIDLLSELSLENARLKRDLSIILENNSSEKEFYRKKYLSTTPIQITGEYDSISIRYKAMETAIKLIGVASVFVILVMAAIWWLMNRYVIFPVENLVSTSEAISSGNLNARVPIKKSTYKRDELGRLAVTFNEMAENLQLSLTKIAEKEQFQQALIDAVPDGIRVIDENYNIITANKAYCEQVGVKMDKVVGVPCYSSSHGKKEACTPSMVSCPLVEIKKTSEPIKAVQRFLKKGGTEQYVEVSAAPMLWKKEKKFIVESIRDLTEDIRFSHQQKLSSIGLLATSVAHEMRNPLGSVQLVLENIIERIETSKIDFKEISKFLCLIQEQLKTCIDVTERMLKLARMPDNKHEPVNLSLAIKETLDLLDYEAKKNGIRVLLDVLDKNIFVIATESEIRMAVVNLVQNAFHAMPTGGELSLSAYKEKDNVIMSVKDNGKGIEKDELDRIFEPFFSARAKGDGTGLGLTITKTIVEKFKGTITVNSQKNKGSTFFVSLPLA
ncbi:MAG: PAS domain S-box protein [Alphaproteobacteria bacterium]|nr:PAS domain S-box protein [Alphaproteobacteria bacterium]